MFLFFFLACSRSSPPPSAPQCTPTAPELRYEEIGAAMGLLDTDDDDELGQDQGAVAMADFDMDGDDDILIAHRLSGVWYQENLGDRLGLERVLEMPQIGMIGVADLDNDGDLDWIAGGEELLLAVMENDGAGNFTDISAQTGLNDLPTLRRKRHAAFGDLDHDGRLDIFLSTGSVVKRLQGSAPIAPSQHQLYRNIAGRFENVSGWLPSEVMRGNGWDGVWTDYDRDGDADLYVAHSDQDRLIPSALLRNDGQTEGGWRLTDAQEECLCVETGPTMGVTAGDLDSDGWPELFVNATGPNHLLYNLRDKSFIDATVSWNAGGTEESRVMSFGNVMADFDNDTRLDLFITTGPLVSGGIETQPDDQSDQLLLQQEDGLFTESAAAAGVADIGVGRGAAMGLLDGDGYPDLLMTNLGDPSRLYRAPCMENRALIVDLVGTRSNHFGVGARLEAYIGDQVMYREIGSNVGWGGSAHPRAWFGLGPEGVVDRLVIRWPSGIVQEIAPGDALRITVEEPAE